MGKIFFAITMFLMMVALAIASPDSEVKDEEQEKNEFWPPDMIPHPHPPQPHKDDKDNWA